MIEVLAATVVVVVVMTAAVGGMIQGVQGIRLNHFALQAKAIANQQMEALRRTASTNFDAIGTQVIPLGDGGTETVRVCKYNPILNQCTPMSPPTNLIEVTITVDWGASRAWRFATLISRPATSGG